MFMIDISVDSDYQGTHWEEPKANVSCGSREGELWQCKVVRESYGSARW